MFHARFCLVLACSFAACAQTSSNGNGPPAGGPDLAENDASVDDSAVPSDDLTADDQGPAVLDVQPATLQMLTVGIGQSSPTVMYTATLNGVPINAGWSIDRGEVGSVSASPSASTTFVPNGSAGGLVTVSAGLNGMVVTRQIQVNLVGQQNGVNPNNPAEQPQIATTPGQLTLGGGVGGVGGEGLGGAVNDPTTLTALAQPAGNGQAQSLAFLYPYDKTVWPRGMLAPLLMWSWATNDADAIQIELSTTSGSFTWKGTFGRPAILTQTGGAFIRHPIPQDIWKMATDSAGGADKLTVSLTVAKAGVAYGPIKETWTIAKGRLAGIIYYNSYGTQLAKNFGGAVGGDHQFGGAVLSIHVGDTAPKLVAGGNGNSSQCRVCHSVAAFGSRLVVQHGDNNNVTTSAYALTPTGTTENVLSHDATYAGLSPDGSLALTASGQLLPLPNDGTPLGTVGLSNVGTPAFAPDGKSVAFNPMAGPGVTNPTQKLMVMAFNPTTNAFTSMVPVVDNTGQPSETRPGWPAFLPDGESLVFHQQTVAGVDGNSLGDLRSRKGARATIAWTSATGSTQVTALDQLNGKDATGAVYLPKRPGAANMSCTADNVQVGNITADHSDDVNMNYEPTVNPIASGSYVWVVFTSRRMYGNEATIPPYCSDPRGVDLIQNITTKKLWVAAIDLNAQPGSDASHPAFYLPAQELLAGNSRGFWVLDPCRMDGQSCDTGDQCCNGFCEPGGDGGLMCQNTPPNNQCSKVQEKCSVPADCCDAQNLCINGFCSSQIL